ncbi:SOS response-associated peptidase family protein [uncultured Paraglaciecola sp.]|uniref:SOS response-associated peptidase family protein n=1 Tax=uncultured Paraglaciecola sp. TaxID=1765024 RepID=UPI0030D6FB47|tara:strand:- start:28451 stop:29149 length:699 start_codon:yes stop_codon:yes gene_type:complete
MCGYIEVDGERQQPVMQFPEREISRRFFSKVFKGYYPAFGQDANKTIDIVIEENGTLKQVAATWWFDCVDSIEGLRVGTRTTFNARNLDSPYWRGALHNNRAIVLATGIGESKIVGKTKHQYYMQSDEVFILGALYRKFSEGRYSCAVITRDAHPKMEPYHDKAFPTFLPNNDPFLKLWLSKSVQQHLAIDNELNHATLYPSLKVQRVKTYKDKVPYKSFEPVILTSDLINN